MLHFERPENNEGYGFAITAWIIGAVVVVVWVAHYAITFSGS
jgi:hypothetical protein